MPPPPDDDWWCEKFASDATVHALRRDVLERRLMEVLRASERRSALLTFAQFWDDHADDEVHPEVVLSDRAVPEWPHLRHTESRSGDRCRRCGWARGDRDGAPYLDWGYGELVPAFEAY
jgi:hypothetical protein